MWERMCLNHSGSRDCTFFSPLFLNTGVQPDVFSFARGGPRLFLFVLSSEFSSVAFILSDGVRPELRRRKSPNKKSQPRRNLCGQIHVFLSSAGASCHLSVSSLYSFTCHLLLYFFFFLLSLSFFFSLSASLCYTSSVVPETPCHARSNCGRAIRPISPISCC